MRLRAREVERLLYEVDELLADIEMLDPQAGHHGPVAKEHEPHIEPATIHADALARAKAVKAHLQRRFCRGT